MIIHIGTIYTVLRQILKLDFTILDAKVSKGPVEVRLRYGLLSRSVM